MGSSSKRPRKRAAAPTRVNAQWHHWNVLIVGLVCMFSISLVLAKPGKTPEASSTLLKMHRLYTLQPPHDSSLYDILAVSPNATVAEIKKSYRKRSRDLHPDKRRKHYQEEEEESESDGDQDEELEKVRQAYEVLKDDKTRLPYHRYGLMETSDAALLLTGGRMGVPTREQRKLLHLMGFGPKVLNPKTRHEQRVLFLAANLVEKIRPLVEGAISESTMADVIARECDSLKRLPLGAQILRCVGRAYRYSGEKALKRHGYKKRRHPFQKKTAAFSDKVQDKFREAKHLLTAAAVSGKLVVTEHVASRRSNSEKKKENELPALGYHGDDRMLDELLGDDDVDRLDHSVSTDEEIRRLEQLKAQNAVIEALQVEALWKITKIDLDRTIQEACNLILEGKYFFFPSHRSKHKRDWARGGDGWVGSTGHVIDARTGRLRAAQALVLIGDIMVKCSKQGTSWME